MQGVIRVYHNKFLILGGDLRSIALAEHLIADEKKVEAFGFSQYNAGQNSKIVFPKDFLSAVQNAEIIVGPVPCCSEKSILNTPLHNRTIDVEVTLDAMTKEQVFIAGRIHADVIDKAAARDIAIFDMLERNEMAILNAIPTAEGAIQIAMEEMQTTLHGSNVMVLGYGRIGKILTKMLQGIGANVFAATRRHDDAATIRSYGYNPLFYHQLRDYLCNMDLIINTVPHIILDKHNLKFIGRNCLIIDLASKPFGVDFEASKKEGLKVMWAPSLPGKVAPVTAASYIKETVYNIVNEWGRST